MKKALITLTTQHYNAIWEHSCSASWNKWAIKNNYSIIRFKNELDISDRAKKRSHAWQKLLAVASSEASKFDYCFWIDADIFINPKAPDPAHQKDTTKISVTIETGSPYSKEHEIIKYAWMRAYQETHNNISWDERGYFENWGFNSQNRPLFNTGMIGFSPKQHSQFFKDIYYQWEEGGAGTLWGEMIPVNLAIQAKGFQILNPKYNRLVHPWSCAWNFSKTRPITNSLLNANRNIQNEDEFINHLFNESYFLHLAGAGAQLLEKYSNNINSLIE